MCMSNNNKKCIIVAAGDFERSLLPAKNPQDLLIAADGGYKYLQQAGIVPDICVGDFDSLGYEPKDCPVIKLPVQKDDTDIIACARIGLDRGYKQFVFLGVMGGERFSHTLAAIQTLHWLTQQGAGGVILHRGCQIRTAKDETVVFPQGCRGDISVFSLTDTSIVTEKGLFYSLDRAQLKNSFPLGVSNSFTGQRGKITVHEGVLAIITEQKV